MASPQTRSTAPGVPPLLPGERMDQKTFHARYLAMPEDVKAELIGGVVYMPSPLSSDQGDCHLDVSGWLANYQGVTPGVRGSDNATTILGDFSEPQPDASLRILPEYGGQCRRNERRYLEGSPELIVEVALSSANFDLGAKRRDYEQLGVQEYLVILVEQEKAVWFVRDKERFVEMPPGPDGIYRSRLFGGLWLDADALLKCDTARLHDVLRQGLAAPEHLEFVERLKERYKP